MRCVFPLLGVPEATGSSHPAHNKCCLPSLNLNNSPLRPNTFMARQFQPSGGGSSVISYVSCTTFHVERLNSALYKPSFHTQWEHSPCGTVASRVENRRRR